MRGLVIALGVLVGCGNAAEDAAREQAAKDRARAPAELAPAVVPKELPPEKPKPPPDPEPTTPAEIDAARMKAMTEGRDKDVIRFCELGKITETSEPQAALGCTLAACRILEADKARTWAKALTRAKKDKPLFDQAVKTCLANKVAL